MTMERKMFGIVLISSIFWMSSAITEMEMIQEKMEHMEQRMVALEARDTSQQKALLEQKEIIQQQGNTITDIQHNMKQQAKVIDDLQDVVSKQQIHIKQQTRKMSIMARRYERFIKKTTFGTKQKLAQVVKQNSMLPEHPGTEATLETKTIEKDSKRMVIAPGPVGFTASASVEELHIGINQNIQFDKVILNLGGGYHNQQGVFIAPQNGIYLFSTSLLLDWRDSSTIVQAEIVHNGKAVTGLIVQDNMHRSDQGSQTTVIQVNQGDEVWIRNVNHVDVAIDGYGYSTFTGYLLCPM